MTNEAITQLATELRTEAIAQSGDGSWSPAEVLSGDWEAFQESLGREPTTEEKSVFWATYSEVPTSGATTRDEPARYEVWQTGNEARVGKELTLQAALGLMETEDRKFRSGPNFNAGSLIGFEVRREDGEPLDEMASRAIREIALGGPPGESGIAAASRVIGKIRARG